MKELWLVLTNPYTYKKARDCAIKQVRQPQPTSIKVYVVFLIDAQTIENMVRDLCDRGWLGASSLHNLESSMLEGYRALAQDVLQEIRQEFEAFSIEVKTSVVSASLRQYVEELLGDRERQIIVSYGGAMHPWMVSYQDRAKFIEEG
jgi:Lhr-like helicase